MGRPWLLYGANGFTGRLIAAEAAARGLAPILAGRNADRVSEVAGPLGLAWRAFPLDDPAALARGIDGAGAVLLAAGPFSATSAPVVEACLAAGVHYLDVTGELDVLEAVHRRGPEAEARGVALLPGAGFDVVATDCLAAALADALPAGTSLVLAFAAIGGGPSRGTARTMLERLPRGGAARGAGGIRPVPLAGRTRVVPFHDRPRPAVEIPWGDLATAPRSTGIADVTVYTAAPARAVRALRVARPLLPLLRLGPARRIADAAVGRWVRGPSAEALERGRTELWGRAEGPAGGAVEGWARTPNGYRFTALAAVECAERVARGELAPGAWTPSRAFGVALLARTPGCEIEIGPARPGRSAPPAEPTGGGGGTGPGTAHPPTGVAS